jgi:hypothetical protein
LIKLYISNKIATNSLDLIEKLSTNNAEYQVYKNYSSIIIPNKKPSIEDCYYINIFNDAPSEFKNKVWTILLEELKFKCAHTKTTYYKGYVLNWSEIFSTNNCSIPESKGISKVKSKGIS